MPAKALIRGKSRGKILRSAGFRMTDSLFCGKSESDFNRSAVGPERHRQGRPFSQDTAEAWTFPSASRPSCRYHTNRLFPVQSRDAELRMIWFGGLQRRVMMTVPRHILALNAGFFDVKMVKYVINSGPSCFGLPSVTMSRAICTM